MVVSTKKVVMWYVTPCSLAHIDHTTLVPSNHMLGTKQTIRYISFAKDGSRFQM
jgi:hypothetical protein